VIPNLGETAERFGVATSLVPVAFAALLTGMVIFTQSVARWFEERNSQGR
jgi:hypothetical protein